MKILEDKYPKGTIPNQLTPGRYMDGYYYDNLQIAAKKIKEDMTFLAIISSSTLEVGTGKSVFAQQTGEAWTDLVNRFHGVNLEFTMKNIVFNPNDLITRSFELPKYSCIILDEWEDAHYWSELAKTLRSFFRKCRQLNLFIICIIPNYFQLPLQYAVSRSLFFVDVKFQGEFERGYFNFYSFDKKKELYIKGKKFQNYHIVKPDFYGRFLDGYAVNEQEYRKAKYEDMVKADEKNVPKTKLDDRKQVYKDIGENLEKVYNRDIPTMTRIFKISSRTLSRWRRKVYDKAQDDADPENKKD